MAESDEDLGLFLCPRMPGGLRLMPASCAKNYLSGKTAEAWETAGNCRGCEIGARHAGEVVVRAPVREHRCATCHSPSHRLVFGVICVSCFNRLAEALRGRNARGQQPRKWRSVSIGDQVAVVQGRLVFVGHGHVRLIARAPTVLVGPQRYLIDTVVGRHVELPCEMVFKAAVLNRRRRSKAKPDQWQLFDD